jgi:hypothetical protein
VKLNDLLKVSLDELRMEMLGVQVLFGFQFQGLFQQGFGEIGDAGRYADAAGLGLLIIVLGILLAIPSQHRLIDKGKATARLQRAATRAADIALAPFAVAIGCAVYVPVSRAFGSHAALATAIAATGFALIMWYGIGAGLRRQSHSRVLMDMKTAATPLHERIDQMLTEARVVLPGAQALLGFQLIVLMTTEFDTLPLPARRAHLVALISVLISVILLIAPAAVHRTAFAGKDDPRAYWAGAILLASALLPLAIGICCDFYVARTRLLAGPYAVICAAVAFLMLVILWYLGPLALRKAAN